MVASGARKRGVPGGAVPLGWPYSSRYAELLPYKNPGVASSIVELPETTER
jgi:hypothetical protein